MPAISKIRFTNVIYENGEKRYNDDIFQFEGHNGAILLENGGGKTVYVQTAIQAILPHAEVADRKIKNTLILENSAAHIAIEWIISERPRRYALTAVTLFMNRGSVDSYKYAYEYDEDDDNSIDKLPFVKDSVNDKKRPATKEELWEYYSSMSQNRINAHAFTTIKDYHEYIEKNFKIIPSEWRKIALINGAEGGVEAFFDACKTTGQLVDNLLIPTVEEALAGEGTKEFAETFEKQREHFKKYKQLKTRIEESKKVESQINSYVQVYEAFDQMNLQLINAKENIKALYKFAEKELEDNKDNLQDNLKTKDVLGEEKRNWEQKNASYELALLNNDKTKKEKVFIEASDSYNQLLASKEEKQKTHDNLKVAEYKLNIKAQAEIIELEKKEIENLDKDEDVIDLSNKLAKNSSELRGYYLEQEEKINKQITMIEGQINNVKKEIQGYDSELSAVKARDAKLNQAKIRLEGTIDSLIKDMDIIQKEILDNSAQETVEEEFEKWKVRITALENEVFEFNKQAKALEEEKQDLLKEIPEGRSKLNILIKEKIELTELLRNLDENHNKLLNRIKEFRSSWFSFDSLYLKQDTILNQIENKLEKLREEKEVLFYNERLAKRWIDAYSESLYYTADPIIETWIKSWKNQFDFIESGTEYIQRIAKDGDKSLQELNKGYPYWTTTIIVADMEFEKLIGKIENKSDELSHPVIILTEKEARVKSKGQDILKEENILFPSTWEKNILQDNFEIWKKDITIKADEATEARKKKEEEFSKCSTLLKEIREFYSKYPYEEYQEFQKHQTVINDNITSVTGEINLKETRIRFIDEEAKKLNQYIYEHHQEQNNLERKILKAQEYSVKKNEKAKNESDINKLNEDLALIKNEISKWDSRLKISSGLEEDLKKILGEAGFDLRGIRIEELYNEVVSASPKYTSISKEALVEQRKNLKDTIEKKQKGREVFEEKIKNATAIKQSLEKNLHSFRCQLSFPIDEDYEFPTFGEGEIKRLIEELSNLKDPLKKLQDNLENAKALWEESKTIYRIKEEDFYEKYDKIIAFDSPLRQMPAILKAEEKDILKREKYLENQWKTLENQRKSIESSVLTLKNNSYEYKYLLAEIKEVELLEDLKHKFPYKRAEVVNEIIADIQRITKTVEDRKQKVDKQKQIFISFCNLEILDVKLKEMAVNGVEYKKAFADIVEWQNKMKERITRTIEIAENDIREHDKEVQQFINHLHSYLITIVQELKQIPKKTKIKIEEDWKEVFSFSVPEWDEKDGKEELAKHIDWMLKQLEGDKFKDENGVELENDVKKAIDKWLQSKQLLQIVMKQNNIKIKCRKVTNDKKMSSKPFSWEESNAWSGGEKWSKNMTLFLGILNYLAEKRTQIQPYNKRYRTVIVDNPFGKASSDHVLDPVFFIAEQLGFQILALTAHAEGKFIRTYFPIVYSCRLRRADNGNSQIMTKEREIRKAFFRDSDPQTLLRLGQLKQMGLFDIEDLK